MTNHPTPTLEELFARATGLTLENVKADATDALKDRLRSAGEKAAGQRAIAAALVLLTILKEREAAKVILRQFLAHYPGGINPYLDDVRTMARALLTEQPEKEGE